MLLCEEKITSNAWQVYYVGCAMQYGAKSTHVELTQIQVKQNIGFNKSLCIFSLEGLHDNMKWMWKESWDKANVIEKYHKIDSRARTWCLSQDHKCVWERERERERGEEKMPN
jgi:hypothetical protein